MTQELDANTTFWNATWQVARKEILQHIRTKRLLIISGLLVFALVLITLVFGPRLTRGFDTSELGVSGENALLGLFLTFGGLLFIQLLPIVLTADAVCSEWASRTIFLLLSKPVSRTAFVLGKFLGSIMTIAGTILVLLGLDYLIMQPLYQGGPTGEEVVGFLAAMGFLVLGCAALAALALFFSTVTRSTALAVLMTLGVWLVGFKIIGLIGFFLNLTRDDPNEKLQNFFGYLDPSTDMGFAVQLLLPEEIGFTADNGSIGYAALALVIHLVLWFSLALLIVRKRNFE